MGFKLGLGFDGSWESREAYGGSGLHGRFSLGFMVLDFRVEDMLGFTFIVA